jgi:threonine/homoserine/homoserine lactone efflux protein
VVYSTFFSAALVLLLVPGPTNTLMGLVGARSGLGRVARLLPAELSGYLTVILPLVWFGSELMIHFPVASVVLKCGAAGWIMFLALKLWGRGGRSSECLDISKNRVYLTTVLNPKALVFGLVLLPSAEKSMVATKLCIFVLLVVSAALTWGVIGKMVRSGSENPQRMQLIQRVASFWLATASIALAAGVLVERRF